ncbi:hypothetical protein QBC43DRAFT_330617 [Cladorrhinum sp. PSN259]|nr:hypothetical protein QBC43DRAFT_330617 [Cladorrhinum sp. PSN259]
MKTTATTLLLAAVAGLASAQSTGGPKPDIPFNKAGWKSLGCYADVRVTAPDTPSELQIFSSEKTFNSVGACAEQCNLLGGNLYPWAAMSGEKCYCGQGLDNPKVDDSECTTPCPGYALELCGGPKALNVYVNTEAKTNTTDNSGSSSSSSSSGGGTTTTVPSGSQPTGNATVSTTSSAAAGATSGPVQIGGAAGKLGGYSVLGLMAGAGLLAL